MCARPLIPFLATLACSFAQVPSLSVPVETLNPGQTAVASLLLASGGQEISAIQFDLQWDNVLRLQFVAGDQLRAGSKIPYVALSSPQTLRCLIAGMNQTAIADGELLKLFLSVDPAASPGTARVSISNIIASDPAGAAVAVNASPIEVQIPAGTASLLLPSSAVLNAASLAPGPLSPGEIITILGFNGTPSVSVQIDGSTAPVLYAGAGQVNAIVPFGLDLTAPASLTLKSPGQSFTFTLPVAPATPGLFTTTGTGLGPGAILNEDYSINSFDNPAQPGSIVMIYGTGFGVLQQPVTDGQAAPGANPTVLPVTATVAGATADVLYAGAAPGLPEGLTQINVRLPAAVVHNLLAPAVLTTGGFKGYNIITVAIQ